MPNVRLNRLDYFGLGYVIVGLLATIYAGFQENYYLTNVRNIPFEQQTYPLFGRLDWRIYVDTYIDAVIFGTPICTPSLFVNHYCFRGHFRLCVFGDSRFNAQPIGVGSVRHLGGCGIGRCGYHKHDRII